MGTLTSRLEIYKQIVFPQKALAVADVAIQTNFISLKNKPGIKIIKVPDFNTCCYNHMDVKLQKETSDVLQVVKGVIKKIYNIKDIIIRDRENIPKHTFIAYIKDEIPYSLDDLTDLEVNDPAFQVKECTMILETPLNGAMAKNSYEEEYTKINEGDLILYTLGEKLTFKFTHDNFSPLIALSSLIIINHIPQSATFL